MKISALRLFNVKRFANRGVAIEGIDDGVNVLCAANEFGKSTSFEALHALFFQPYSGTPGDVKNLRPYSGGNPLVEADIATPKGNFRITKQYFGGKFARIVDLESGRLIAQADEAENFVAALVKGGAVGPAGLLWVRQGLTGVEKRSGREEENEKQVRASLLESVQGEVEAVTGGRRMAEIMAAVEEDLSALATPKGKPRERYAAAIEGRDKLDAERQKLWADLTRLREALDRRTSAMKRLAELDSPEDAQRRRAAIETAQAAFDAAKVQSEKLKRAEAELRLAHERRNSAAGHLQNFQAALQSSKELRQGIDDAQRLRSDAADKRHAAWRNWGSWFTNRLTDVILDKPRGFYLSSFRCVSAQVARNVAANTGPFPYIDGMILQATQRIGAIEVRHDDRSAGRSGYTMRRLVRLWLSTVVNFSVMPLRMATVLGLLMGLVGTIGVACVIYLRLTNRGPTFGWGSLMAALLVFSGAQLVMLGVIGEYLGRVFLAVNQRPQSLVREIVRGGPPASDVATSVFD